jgi:hypothetical protein
MREMVAEAGYLSSQFGASDQAVAQSEPTDMMESIGRALAGEDILSGNDEERAADWRRENQQVIERDTARGDLERALAETDVPNDDPALLDRALTILLEKGGDPLDAYEAAIDEAIATEADEAQEDIEALPGWDDEITETTEEVQPGTVPPGGERTRPQGADSSGRARSENGQSQELLGRDEEARIDYFIADIERDPEAGNYNVDLPPTRDLDKFSRGCGAPRMDTRPLQQGQGAVVARSPVRHVRWRAGRAQQR